VFACVCEFLQTACFPRLRSVVSAISPQLPIRVETGVIQTVVIDGIPLNWQELQTDPQITIAISGVYILYATFFFSVSCTHTFHNCCT
jgi:hypothetical protein